VYTLQFGQFPIYYDSQYDKDVLENGLSPLPLWKSLCGCQNTILEVKLQRVGEEGISK
jgi:hypothetical protein